MPAVSPKRKKLSPLDEESRPKMEQPLKHDSAISSLQKKEVYDILHSLSVTILSGRDRIDAATPLDGHNMEVANKVIKRGLPLCIEVLGRVKYSGSKPGSMSDLSQSDGSGRSNEEEAVLIEKWILQFSPTADSDCLGSVTSGPFLSQAVQSFLHFSQINSWTVSNGGCLPFDLMHRAYSSDSSASSSSSFLFHSPDTHLFPTVRTQSTPGHIHVSVTHLPRLSEIPPSLLSTSSNSSELDNQLTLIQNGDRLTDSSSSIPRCAEIMVSKSWTPMYSPTNLLAPSQQAKSWNGLVSTGINCFSPQPQVQYQILNKGNKTKSTLLSPNESSDNGGFPFSPPNPSPLSHKVLPLIPASSDDLKHCNSPIISSVQTNSVTPVKRKDEFELQSCIEQLDSISLSANCTSTFNSSKVDDETTVTSIRMNSSRKNIPFASSNTSSGSSRVVISRLGEAGLNPSIGNGFFSASSNAGGHLQGVTDGWRGKVRPPGASSPIPFLLRHSTFGGSEASIKDNRKKLKRRSYGVVYTKNPSCHVPPTRSMSLPAVVPNLCLLGTFEESVLNGRIDPLGFVEGFTAELGASGSFCPQHITLPVTASFFSLSDDGSPSPYLGHIDLSSVKKRGYHIPGKGTVQLTLFNPTKTVVKIFVVTYDNTDMPPNTSTFIRQKTLSRPSHDTTDSAENILPSLQYLIHLRFLCSKSSRTYLHTDIKLLFARRAPDTDPDLSKVSLYTIHEGPSNPKYGPLNNECS